MANLFDSRLSEPSIPAKFTKLRLMALAHMTLAIASILIAWALGRNAFVRRPWIELENPWGWCLSLGLGFLSALAMIRISRVLERRMIWARSLNETLRPFARHESNFALLAFAALGGVGEELFFRGLTAQVFGIFISSLAFGAVHQVRGPGRVGWMVCATLLGLWLAILFATTGNLIGPIVAHVVINAANLRHLRDHKTKEKPRRLGGLLAR